MTKKIGGQLAPPHPVPPKSSDHNFEIAILFNIVESSKNYAFGDNMIPTAPEGGSLNYITCPLFTHSICCWEVWINFQSEGGVVIFLMGVFFIGEEVSGG